MAQSRHSTFDEFWTHYLRQHRGRANRRLHAVGAAAALAIAAVALARRKPRWLALVPVAGYVPAWCGHLLVDRNRPTSLAHPLWSLRADMRMLLLMATGRLQKPTVVARRSAPRPGVAGRRRRTVMWWV